MKKQQKNPSLQNQGFEKDNVIKPEPNTLKKQKFDSNEVVAQQDHIKHTPNPHLNQGVVYDTVNEPLDEQPLMHNDNLEAQEENDGINEILRGEISAQEAYDQVFDTIKEDPEIRRLEQLRADHRQAVQYWKNQAHSEMSSPEQTSGVWGTAVEAFVGVSKLLGQKAALKALKQGEEHGLNNYKKMLKRDELTAVQKNEIRNNFIPCQQQHISTLNSLMSMQ